MKFLKVIWVELLFMQNTPYARVGDIQAIGNGSSIRRRVLVYVLKDVLFKVESATRPWSITVSLPNLKGTVLFHVAVEF